MEAVDDDAGAIEGETKLERADFEAAFDTEPTVRRARWLVAWVLAGLVSGGLLLIWDSIAQDSNPPGLAHLFLAAFSFVVLTFVLSKSGPLSTTSLARKALLETGTSLSYRFDDNGVAFTTERASVELEWEAVPRARELSRVFVIFVGHNNFYVLPKRALSEDEIERLGDWLPDSPREQSAGGQLLKAVALWAALVLAFLCIWAFMTDSKGHDRDAPGQAP